MGEEKGIQLIINDNTFHSIQTIWMGSVVERRLEYASTKVGIPTIREAAEVANKEAASIQLRIDWTMSISFPDRMVFDSLLDYLRHEPCGTKPSGTRP